jgi:hypothetical protein
MSKRAKKKQVALFKKKEGFNRLLKNNKWAFRYIGAAKAVIRRILDTKEVTVMQVVMLCRYSCVKGRGH